MSSACQNGNYEFSWAVNDVSSGNDFGHSEKRKGSDTAGQYHVLLPDGRTQTVQYSVDPYSGFQARVIYDDRAQEKPFTPTRAGSGRALAPNRGQGLTPSSVRTLAPSRYNPAPAPSAHQPFAYQPRPSPYTGPTRAPAQPRRPVVIATLAPHKFRQAKTFEPVEPTPIPHHQVAALRYNPRARQPSHGHGRGGGIEKKEDDHDHVYDKKERTIEEMKRDDPYLRTEDELRGRDFDQPFFYPYNKKALGGKRDQKHHSRLEHNVGRGSTRNIVKELKLKSRVIPVRQLITKSSRDKRLERCQKIVNFMKHKCSKNSVILFSDEKIFTVDWVTNRQNYRYL
eukprot:snap_masked-scaffold116_size340332-processed-gene-1.10 protein:Tk07655 transcript:snap_masked-scaffold116_size340332-processed-gene-1.10-mRNA-1 annotation:"larval cuticle protein a3a-like"